MSQLPPHEDPDSLDGAVPVVPRAGVTDVELDEVVRRHTSSRQRLARTGVVLAALLLVVGLLVFNAAQPPTPQPPQVDAQAGPVVLVSNVNFGAVTLNGQRLVGAPPMILPLRAGVNQITLDAPPFLPQSCRLTGTGDLLPYGGCTATGLYASVEVGNTTVHPSRVIVLPLTGGDLPRAQALSAEALVAQALAAASAAPLFATSALPGELLPVSAAWPVAINSQPASHKARGSMRFGLFGADDYTVRGRLCPMTLCAGSAITENAPTDAGPRWNIVADAYVVWSFDAHGSTPPAAFAYPLEPAPEFPLTYQAGTGWHVDILPAEADRPLPNILAGGLCGAGAYALRAMTQQLQDQATVLQDRTVGGCEVELRHDGTSANDGVFLWRFGVLLAADANAHATLPSLPVAPAVELARFAAAPQ